MDNRLNFSAQKANEMWLRIDKESPVRTRQFRAAKQRASAPHINHQARYRKLSRASRRTA